MTDQLPALLGPAPETTRDRLDRIARCQAVAALVKGEEDRVRADLEADADTIEAATGGAYNVPMKGLGRVYRTDPQPKPYVADREAVERWMREEEPDLVGYRDAVEVVDHPGLLEAIAELDALARDHVRDNDGNPAGQPAGPLPLSHATTDAARLLRRSLRVVRTPLLPADPVQALLDLRDAEEHRYVLTPDGVVHVPTGVLVPGIETRTAARQLTVKVEPDAKRRYVAELRALLGAGQLQEATPDA